MCNRGVDNIENPRMQCESKVKTGSFIRQRNVSIHERVTFN